ncbi:GGDEF domain-containing response regulator [Leptospira sp. GIMC2001]|uniref:GGDEF domain-containing response regulator n=1 Tax=Leptospira sp. GIMC2001 TaxID=1513297 RepID=UPI00234AB1C8|nr:diguanylate cyclase [Leptospira sp. GIMC2001]WCL48850.1 diguanylate cyclase [Leptospira sp. GIMC2001]
MKILIIDDSVEKAMILQRLLNKNLPYKVDIVPSAEEGLDRLEYSSSNQNVPYDIVLMDILLPGMNGIQATEKLKKLTKYEDIPILMITSSSDEEFIDSAFKAGAMDYINTTPIRPLELLARVNSAIRLRNEMDRRKKREEELLETTRILNMTNRLLEKISSHDPLTNLYNRRYFDQFLEFEWNKLSNSKKPITLLMLDVDFFKSYNDEYGHQAGDTALKKVAEVLSESATRNRDTAARYGGEEFCLILPETDASGGLLLAKTICNRIYNLKIQHKHSAFNEILTISIGVATAQPEDVNKMSMIDLIEKADKALYEAKSKGRNQVVAYDSKK